MSVDLLAATLTRHWLEYVDWADPIVEEPLRIVDGKAQPCTKPGNGLSWKRDNVAKYLIS